MSNIDHKILAKKYIPFQQIHPEIIELLGSLRARRIKIGLISNCSEEEVKFWADSQLAEYFDDYIFSFEVKCSKPDPSIYSMACNRMDVRPEESFFVGDGGSNELDGAAAAGLRPFHAFWFNTYIQSQHKKLSRPKELLEELI